jgi:hypothetical protein
MALWAGALEVEARAGRRCRVAGSLEASANVASIELDSALHLANGVRAYRNPRCGEWVEALLAGDIGGAQKLSRKMSNSPANITRVLRTLKEWLRLRQRGGRRTGLVISSGAVRLVGRYSSTSDVERTKSNRELLPKVVAGLSGFRFVRSTAE